MKKYIAIATILSFAVSAVPALAGGHYHSRHQSNPTSIITVSNSNWAMVSNTVGTGANTGGNTAVGGSAGNLVSGSGVNGGNDAVGGYGGSIETGEAIAFSGVSNTANSNKTNVDACGCDNDGDSTITVSNHNGAFVGNEVGTEANTGYNTAVGGDAGNLVIGSSSRTSRHHHSSSTGWNGGNDAVGGVAGNMTTGAALGESNVVNVLNTNVTRVN